MLHGVQRVFAFPKLSSALRQHRRGSRGLDTHPTAVRPNERNARSRSGRPEDKPAWLAQV